jgi:hypothetical protein
MVPSRFGKHSAPPLLLDVEPLDELDEEEDEPPIPLDEDEEDVVTGSHVPSALQMPEAQSAPTWQVGASLKAVHAAAERAAARRTEALRSMRGGIIPRSAFPTIPSLLLAAMTRSFALHQPNAAGS